MERFDIKVTALANVSSTITVHANSEEQAEEQALVDALVGRCHWHLDKIEGSTIELGI